ncbi:MAG TPA: mandelate racemase/muconate lactonizing enzyme family protein [Streptosporangiaceae bacterium]|nr:mandelate racemase/muconate lactonizing enzyme family protein [Streptosporangiaceae bacterium]
MKVTGIEVFPISLPPPARGGSRLMILRLDTDAGISGYGEMMLLSNPFRWPVVAAMLEDLVEQALIGHDPYHAEERFDRIYGRAGYSHAPEQTKLGMLSALDMACYDIVGKDLGQPVHRLLGGPLRDRVRTYTYLYADEADEADASLQQSLRTLWLDPGYSAARARHYVDLGFTAVKLDPFSLTVSEDQALGQTVPLQFTPQALETAESVIAAIRAEVGPAADILIGTHGQMTPASAIRFARRIEACDPLWFEEPVPPENAAALAEVARATTIPITTGERLTSKHDFARLLSHRAAAIFNFDVGLVGGILEAKKIAAMAEAHYVQIAPHVYGGPMIAAASLELSLCSPNFLIMEGVETFGGIYNELADPPFDWRDGFLYPSGRPGLGHDLREDVARRLRPDGPGPSLVRVY